MDDRKRLTKELHQEIKDVAFDLLLELYNNEAKYSLAPFSTEVCGVNPRSFRRSRPMPTKTTTSQARGSSYVIDKAVTILVSQGAPILL